MKRMTNVTYCGVTKDLTEVDCEVAMAAKNTLAAISDEGGAK